MRTVLCAALAVTICSGTERAAHAVTVTPAGGPVARPPIVLVANGCGPGFFRTIAGDCRPNRRVFVGPRRGVVAPPPCPPGFLRDPDPARPLCYPVY